MQNSVFSLDENEIEQLMKYDVNELGPIAEQYGLLCPESVEVIIETFLGQKYSPSGQTGSSLYRLSVLEYLVECYGNSDRFMCFLKRCSNHFGLDLMLNQHFEKPYQAFFYLTGDDEKHFFLASNRVGLPFFGALIAFAMRNNEDALVKYINSGRAAYEKSYVLSLLDKSILDILAYPNLTSGKKRDLLNAFGSN